MEYVQGGKAVGGRVDPVSLFFENMGDDLDQNRIVVDDQNIFSVMVLCPFGEKVEAASTSVATAGPAYSRNRAGGTPGFVLPCQFFDFVLR